MNDFEAYSNPDDHKLDQLFQSNFGPIMASPVPKIKLLSMSKINDMNPLKVWRAFRSSVPKLKQNGDKPHKSGVITLMELTKDGKDIDAFKATWHGVNLNKEVVFKDVKFEKQEIALARLC